jgi:phosphinothricin acetyltransferase
VIIRLAQTGDLSSIAAIYNHEVLHSTATLDTDVRSDAEWQQWLSEQEPERYPAFVATDEDGAKVLGWSSLKRWSPRRGYDRCAEVSVYVHKDSRGMGIGRQLLENLIKAATERGHGYLAARIGAASAASLKLHAKLGFEHVGTMRRVGEKFGEVVDVVLMGRILS